MISIDAKFPLGRIGATPNALAHLTSSDIDTALRRHAQGDWGDVDEEDRQENELSLARGSRPLSEVAHLVKSGQTTAADAARLFNVHPSTVSRILKRHRAD